MRKRITGADTQDKPSPAPAWLDVQHLAQVEVSSEQSAAPIEAALVPGHGPGWRAGGPGPQTVRLLFDSAQRLKRLRLVFVEDQHARTQEFVLRWSGDGGRTYREIVRQQFTFSPTGTTREVEEYTVDLDGVTTVELQLVPDISGGDAPASLASWQVG